MIRTANWKVRSGGSWNDCSKIKVNIGGVWYPYDKVRILSNGEWIGCKSLIRFSSGNTYASLSFSKDGGSQTLTIIDNYRGAWYVYEKPSWVSISENNGNFEQTVTVTVGANTGGSLAGTIKITSTVDSSVFLSINVLQDTAIANLHSESTNPFTVAYNVAANYAYIKPVADLNQAGIYIISKPDWITVAAPDAYQRRYLTFTNNQSVNNRVGEIKVGVSGYADVLTYTATQTGRPATILNVTPTTATVDYFGRVIVNDNGNYDLSITVSSNETWTVSKNFDWVNFMDVDYGNSTNQILLSKFHTNPSTSPRTGIVTITSEYGTTATVTVTQEGKPATPTYYINVSESYFDFDVDGILGYDFTINTNDSWFIYSKPSWIVLEPNKGTNTKNVTITALPNIRKARNGTVVLKTNSGLTCNLQVSQEGAI